MDPLRPLPQAAPTAAAQGADAARLAAQKAFFEMALNTTGAGRAQPAAQAPAQAAQAQSQPVQRIPDPTAAAPERPLRPGSLLDIRV